MSLWRRFWDFWGEDIILVFKCFVVMSILGSIVLYFLVSKTNEEIRIKKLEQEKENELMVKKQHDKELDSELSLFLRLDDKVKEEMEYEGITKVYQFNNLQLSDKIVKYETNYTDSKLDEFFNTLIDDFGKYSDNKNSEYYDKILEHYEKINYRKQLLLSMDKDLQYIEDEKTKKELNKLKDDARAIENMRFRLLSDFKSELDLQTNYKDSDFESVKGELKDKVKLIDELSKRNIDSLKDLE